MPAKKYRQNDLKPGVYRVGKKFLELTQEDLGSIARNTQAMLAAGVHVPLLPSHTKPGADNGVPQFSRSNADARSNCGWMTGVEQLEDGSISPTIEVTDEKSQKGIEDGSIKFTSPDIHEFTDGKGRNWGTVFRHLAFTPTPRNPDQGPFEALQLSLDDLTVEPDAAKKAVRRPIVIAAQFAEDDMSGKGKDTDKDMGSIETPSNPDIVNDTTNLKSKTEAFVANMSTLGVELPSDFCFDDLENALDIISTGVKTATKAKVEADAKDNSADDEDMPPLTEERPPVGAQFSEDDLAMNAQLEQMQRKIDAQQKQLIARCRADLAGKVGRSTLPPGLKKKLSEHVGAVQFSEDGDEEPVFTLSEVEEMFREALPKGMQFSEDGTPVEAPHPDGDGFFTGNDSDVPKTMEEARAKTQKVRDSLRG